MLDISTFLIKFHMLWLSFKQKVPKQEQKDLRKSKLFIIPHTMKDYSSESDQDFVQKMERKTKMKTGQLTGKQTGQLKDCNKVVPMPLEVMTMKDLPFAEM